MKKPQLWAGLLCFYALFIIGCGGSTSVGVITSPQSLEEQTYGILPEFIVEFNEGLPNVFTAELNNTDVTAYFALEPAEGDQLARAYAVGADLAAFVVPGENVFDVVDPASIGSVTFIYDNKGPEVRITDYAEDSGNAVITGYLHDESGVTSLTLNAVNIPLTDGAFTINTPLTEFYAFTATDTFGITQDTTFRAGGQPQDAFAALQLNPAGLPVALELVEQLVYAHDYAAFLATGDNAHVLDMSILGQSVDIYITDIRAPNYSRNADFNITLMDGDRLGLAGYIHDMELDLTGNVRLCFLLCANVGLSGVAYADDTFIDAQAQVVVDADNTLTAGNINISDINIGDVRIELDGGIAADLMSSIINSLRTLLFGLIETLAEEPIIELVPPLVQSLYADLDKTIVIPVDLGLGTPTAALEMTIAPSDASITSTEALVTVNGIVSPDVVRKPSLGYYYKGVEAFPTLPALTPSGLSYHVGAMLSEDAFNMTLESAHRAGIFDISATTTELAEFDIAAIVLIQNILYSGDLLGSPLLDESDEVRVRVSVPSTPLVELTDSATPVSMTLTDADLIVEFREDATAEWQSLLGATVDLSVPFSVGFDSSTNSLVLNGDVDNFDVKYSNSNPNGLFRMGQEFGQLIFEAALPFVFPLITDVVKGLELPTYAGYSMDAQEIWVVPNTNVIAIGANLQ